MSQDQQDRAAQNRAMFPETARFVDEMREAFGPDVRLVWASENGREIGERGPDGVQPVIERRTEAVKTLKTRGKK
jgi:hypothetical protein